MNRALLACCLLAALLLVGCGDFAWNGSGYGGGPPSTGPQPTAVPPGGQIYVAVSGDTVDSVAQQFGVPVQSLIDANRLAMPYDLYPGQQLVIPGSGSAPGNLYTVVGGDTLTRIARQHATTVSELAAVNGLQPPYLLKIGQQLRLPGAAGTDSASASGMVLPPAQSAPSLPPAGSATMTTENLAPPAGVRAAPAPATAAATTGPAQAAAATSAVTLLPPTLTPVTPTAPPPGQPPVAPTPSQAAAPGSESVLPPPPEPKPATLSPIGQATAALEPQAGQASTEQPPAPRTSGKFLWPVNGKVISPFGPKDGGQHNDGINIAAPLGTPVRAAENGVVVYAGNELRGFGNLLLVRHADGWVSAYAHCDSLLVKRGAQVKRGQVIARVGQTGNVASPQLHFELRKGAQAVDPMAELAPQGA